MLFGLGMGGAWNNNVSNRTPSEVFRFDVSTLLRRSSDLHTDTNSLLSERRGNKRNNCPDGVVQGYKTHDSVQK